MSDRTFTLDEAQALLPVLESLLRTAMNAKNLMEQVEAEQQALAHRLFLNGAPIWTWSRWPGAKPSA